MTKLLKIFLPPFIGFAVFFLAVRYSTLYFTLKIDEMGAGNLTSFMAYYRYVLPLLFSVAVLTQILIAIPLWRFLNDAGAVLKITVILDMTIICALLAAGISFAIWDKSSGMFHLVKLVAFMTSVQLVYWIINMAALYLLD